MANTKRRKSKAQKAPMTKPTVKSPSGFSGGQQVVDATNALIAALPNCSMKMTLGKRTVQVTGAVQSSGKLFFVTDASTAKRKVMVTADGKYELAVEPDGSVRPL